MKKSSFISLLILSLGGLAFPQSPNSLLDQIRQIKPLVSTREEVKRLLSEYEASDDDYHNQNFSRDDVDITVYYSSGKCSDEPEEDDAREIWSVKEWVVARIEIEPSEPFKIEDVNLDLSKFTKEFRYSDSEDSYVYHSKSQGIALMVNDDGIEQMLFFPPLSKSKRLCAESTIAKDFYSEKSWFGKSKPGTSVPHCPNSHANVDGLNLSSDKLTATDSKRISVKAIATDPENDVLSYVYFVSAGKILGAGADVIWDLSSVASGTYTITAGVDDGVGVLGRTTTKTVRVY